VFAGAEKMKSMPMSKSWRGKTMKTGKKNLTERLEAGQPVLDYFDVRRGRIQWPAGGAGRLVAIRQSAGLSQQSFSRALGISPRTLQQWEQGRRRPEGPARSLLRLVSLHPWLLRRLAA
jgi:putative transcriptional regulator